MKLQSVFFLLFLSAFMKVYCQNLREGIVLSKDESEMTDKEKVVYYNSISIDTAVIGDKFPTFECNGLDGIPLRNDTVRRIAFYNFWFTSCPPCIAEIPMFNRLVQRFGDSVDFIAITFEDKDDVVEFLDNNEFKFRHFVLDRSIMNKLNLTRGFPTTVVVVDGEIVHRTSGGMTEAVKFFEERTELWYQTYSEIILSHLN